ncbi:hypothetical protein KGM_204941 [Danaus plexippus plexippus]|uniref:Fibronectin type III domain-containing protein n=1 Tax=Danaus plexippus plexippus TaxID=278856 RepID=A0A212ELI0_DANPL|nr:hypothetical protein KGM_204941 [Danaus plexippus plexippus]
MVRRTYAVFWTVASNILEGVLETAAVNSPCCMQLQTKLLRAASGVSPAGDRGLTLNANPGVRHMRWSHTHTQSLECEEGLLARCNRPRINSAIFVSAEPTSFAGFDPSEFLRRHGSQSQLCRKARSADNIPLTTMSDSSERLCKIKAPREETINEEAKSEDSGSVETVRHFGLPILSVSGPSPPDEDYDQIDEYL